MSVYKTIAQTNHTYAFDIIICFKSWKKRQGVCIHD